MTAQLSEPRAGEPTWKLWQHVAALVRAVRPWQNAKVVISDAAGTVSAGATGSFKQSEGNVVLELKGVGGGGGSGEDNLEEVTGAVNGVPATLMVQTDGNGWTEI